MVSITVINFINMYIFIKQTKKLKLLIFKRFFSFIDFVVILCSVYVSTEMYGKSNVVSMRVIESILIVFQMFKSLYFMRFVQEIAPLIDIIFVILNDIKYFVMIFIVIEFAFMIAYY